MMKKICFIFLLLTMFPCAGFAQSADNNQTVYTLSPLLSVKAKIYVLDESDLSKYQLPQNYMIVRNPSKVTVTLWEFPNQFPADQSQQLPTAVPSKESTKISQEKQKSLAEPGQMTKMLGSLGLGAGKEISISDLNQLLTGANKK
jgi:hypothetical protein